MTPAQKATQLVDEMKAMLPSMSGMENIIAENCAETAVIEIIDALVDYGDASFELQNMDRTLAYWHQVKCEIEKL